MATRRSILILDGGMSRELIRLQAPFRQPEWSALALMETPHLVQQVHEEFLAAGAEIITTNSYAIVPFHLGGQTYERSGESLAALAGHLARAAVDAENLKSGRKLLVAGSLPPIFGSYEPGNFDQATVQELLRPLVRGLTPYVDVWLGETLSLVAEGEAVCEAVRATGKPIWISFTLDDRREISNINEGRVQARLRSGETIDEASRWAMKAGVDGLLFNCSQPEFMLAALQDANPVVQHPEKIIRLGAYANAFPRLPADYHANKDITPVRPEITPEKYAEYARQWIETGATIVGGCCGVGSHHINHVAHLKGRLEGG